MDPRAAALDSVCRWRKPGSSACGSAAVVVADGSSTFKAPSLSTRSSKFLALPVDACLDLLLSSNILPRSRISCRAFRLRSTASGSSSSRVEVSGEVSLDSEGRELLHRRGCVERLQPFVSIRLSTGGHEDFHRQRDRRRKGGRGRGGGL